MKKAILIKTDGTWKEVEPLNKKDFQLEELYEMLECEMVELVFPSNTSLGQYMIIDEEGKLKKEPKINIIATRLHGGDIIVGNALICSPSQFK